MTQVLRSPTKQPVREEGTRPGPIYRPDADILERAEEYVVRVDLPGADEQSVQVRFDKDVLTIEANPAVAPDPAWTPSTGPAATRGSSASPTASTSRRSAPLSGTACSSCTCPRRAGGGPGRSQVAAA